MNARLPILLALACLSAAAARAQTASRPPTNLSGLTVALPAKTLPKVAATYPGAGKSVPPGALILKVTFDQKMNPLGWDFAKGQDRYPQCLPRPRLLADEKTFILLCTVGPSSHFSVTLNATEAGGFENVAGQRAAPATLDFATTDDRSLSTIKDAMKAADLKDDEGPVMDSQALASGPHPAPP